MKTHRACASSSSEQAMPVAPEEARAVRAEPQRAEQDDAAWIARLRGTGATTPGVQLPAATRPRAGMHPLFDLLRQPRTKVVAACTAACGALMLVTGSGFVGGADAA